jgi:hypothetical protein
MICKASYGPSDHTKQCKSCPESENYTPDHDVLYEDWETDKRSKGEIPDINGEEGQQHSTAPEDERKGTYEVVVHTYYVVYDYLPRVEERAEERDDGQTHWAQSLTSSFVPANSKKRHRVGIDNHRFLLCSVAVKFFLACERGCCCCRA